VRGRLTIGTTGTAPMPCSSRWSSVQVPPPSSEEYQMAGEWDDNAAPPSEIKPDSHARISVKNEDGAASWKASYRRGDYWWRIQLYCRVRADNGHEEFYGAKYWPKVTAEGTRDMNDYEVRYSILPY
jgi:hypothetical protein